MMIVAGGSYEVDVDVGVNGRVSDGAVLKCSKFGQKLEIGEMNLPDFKS